MNPSTRHAPGYAGLLTVMLSACGAPPPEELAGDVGQSEEAVVLLSPPSAGVVVPTFEVIGEYRLFLDGVLAFRDSTSTRSNAVAHCQWSVGRFPQKKVECRWRGSVLGYEFFSFGKRVRYEPALASKLDAIVQCDSDRNPFGGDKCTYDGKVVPLLTPWPADCGGVPTYVVRTASGNCGNVAGWTGCALGSDLCVYTWSSGTPSDKDVAALDAIAYETLPGSDYALAFAEPVCGSNRPSCSAPTSLPVAQVANSELCLSALDSKACCVASSWFWIEDENGEGSCSGPGNADGCAVCDGSGFINGDKLTVVLGQLGLRQSTSPVPVTYTVAVKIKSDDYALEVTPPPLSQVFTVTVDNALKDGTVVAVR